MPAKKKKTTTSGSPRTVTIKFKCNPSCQAQPPSPIVHRNAHVVLSAIGTDVTLNFTSSPFKSRRKQITITAGNSVTQVISPTAGLKEYDYSLACTACSSGLGEPSMIVEA
jgi:hypothetical protein